MKIPVCRTALFAAEPDPTTPGSYWVVDPSKHLLASSSDPERALAERLAKFGCDNEQTFILRYADNSKPMVNTTIGDALSHNRISP